MTIHTYSPAEPWGAWIAYQGEGAIALAAVLAVAAIVFAVFGMRVKKPIALARPGPVVGILIFAIWMLSIVMLFVALLAYGIQLKEIHLAFKQEKPQIGTIFYAAVTFVVIAVLTRKHGWKAMLGSAFAGAAAAPMLFELPFDLIVMPVVYPPVQPTPWVYRLLYFCPLFLLELSTIALLCLSPCVRITRAACFALAGMFAVWVVWAAAFGFAYPVAPGPLAVNVVSKILCFVAAISLFAWPGQLQAAPRKT